MSAEANIRTTSTSAKQKGRALVESGVAPKMMEDGLPFYGAQHRQDAFWEGGNEALPPGWRDYDVGHHGIQYQDDNLAMVSWKRPLPGVRLDSPGQLLVPGWEWHISPLGWSYFVNHNNRMTSWNKPIRERPPGSLTARYTIKGHSRHICSVACVGNSRSVISASGDGSIRQWTRDGKTIGQPWRSDGGPVSSIVVSPDERMVVSGSVDGRIRLWDIMHGRIVGKPWEGHNAAVRCVDWSPNGQEIASGSQDGTIRLWNPSGRQIAPPIEVGQIWCTAVKYSPQGDKFAACATDDIIRVWSKNGELLIEISKRDGYWVASLCWSMDGTCIFSGSGDGTIRKWRLIDREELIVLRGHTDVVTSLCLTMDECYLLSASADSSVRIWDLGTNKPVGEPLWHDDQVYTVAMSPDRRYIASGGLDKAISLWDFEAALKQSSNQSAHDNNSQSNAKLNERTPSSRDILDVSTGSQPQLNHTSSSKYGDNFWGIDPHHSTGGSAPLSSPSPSRRNLFDFLRFNPRPAAVVEVPLTKRKLLNVSKWDVQRKEKEKEKAKKNAKEKAKEKAQKKAKEKAKEKAKQANIANGSINTKNAATSSHPPTQDNITQKSAGPPQALPFSEPQAAVFTLHTSRADPTPPAATTRDDDRYPPPTQAEMAKVTQNEPGTAIQDGSALVQESRQEVSAQMGRGQNAVSDADEQPRAIGCCGIYLVLGGRRPQ